MMNSSKFYIFLFLSLPFLSYSQAEKKTNIEEYIENRRDEAEKLWRMYQYKKALAITKECIKKSDSINNDTLLAKSYHTNGIINNHLGNIPVALNNYKKAITIFKKIKNFPRIGLSYNNIGIAYFTGKQIQLDSSIVYLEKSLHIFEQTKNASRILLVAGNLGEVYKKANKLNKGKQTLIKAIYYAKLIPLKTKEDKIMLSSSFETFAEIYFKKNNLQKALKYINLSQEIAEKENLEQRLLFAYKLKHNILQKLGDIKNACSILKKYNDYLNITSEIEKSRLSQEYAVKFKIKEDKVLLEKTKLENNSQEEALKKTMQIMFFIVILFLISITASILLYKNNLLKKDNNKLLILKNEKLKELQNKTELIFLKTQIQPHFFFNTLAILHKLLLERSKKAEDVVVKLSELMQYSIYEAKKENITIWDEINSFQNYLEIESLSNNQNTSTVQINGDINHIQVPPLLYFSFIENCFNFNKSNGSYQKFHLFFENLDNTYLLFNLSSEDFSFEEKKEALLIKNMKNIERRLSLIYKNDYSLAVQSTQNTFNASLKIPIVFPQI